MQEKLTSITRSKDEYCIEVCKAKCCRFKDGTSCIHLCKNSKCGVYNLRFVTEAEDYELVGHRYDTITKQILPIICGRIERQIADGILPKEIEAQCCYAHPELLKV